MKKILYFCLIVFGIGLVISLVGMGMGGHLYATYYNGSLHRVDDAIALASDHLDYYVYDFRSSYSPASGIIEAPSDYDTIEKLDFELAAGSFSIVPGDRFSVSGGVVKQNHISSDKWKLSVTGQPKDSSIIITIPEAQAFEKVSISIGAGDLTASVPFSANEIDIDVGAGNMQAASLLAEELDIDVGAGDFSAEFVNAKDFSLDVGMGNASLTLADSCLNYSYKYKAAMGSIWLNNMEINDCLDEQRKIEENRFIEPTHEIDINCGMGNVKLFTES